MFMEKISERRVCSVSRVNQAFVRLLNGKDVEFCVFARLMALVGE